MLPTVLNVWWGYNVISVLQVDISGAKKNSAVAGLLRSAMLPLQQVVDGRCSTSSLTQGPSPFRFMCGLCFDLNLEASNKFNDKCWRLYNSASKAWDLGYNALRCKTLSKNCIFPKICVSRVTLGGRCLKAKVGKIELGPESKDFPREFYSFSGLEKLISIHQRDLNKPIYTSSPFSRWRAMQRKWW